jgi:hypothetical protein
MRRKFIDGTSTLRGGARAIRGRIQVRDGLEAADLAAASEDASHRRERARRCLRRRGPLSRPGGVAAVSRGYPWSAGAVGPRRSRE